MERLCYRLIFSFIFFAALFHLNRGTSSPNQQGQAEEGVDSLPNTSDWTTPKFAYDPAEDELLDFSLNCKEVFSVKNDLKNDMEIRFIIRNLDLRHNENFHDFVVDPICSRLGVSKCHLLTATQLNDLISSGDTQKISGYISTGCLQRASHLEVLKTEHVRVLTTNGLRHFEHWPSLLPSVFINFLYLLNYNVRLSIKKESLNEELVQMLSSKELVGNHLIWDLFDVETLGLFAENIEFGKLFFELARPSRRLNEPITVINLHVIGRLGTRLQIFLFNLIVNGGDSKEVADLVHDVANEIKKVSPKSFLLTGDVPNVEKENLWNVWKTPFYSLAKGINWAESFLSPNFDESKFTILEQKIGQKVKALSLLNGRLLGSLSSAFKLLHTCKYEKVFSEFSRFIQKPNLDSISSSTSTMAQPSPQLTNDAKDVEEAWFNEYLNCSFRTEMGELETAKLQELIKNELGRLERRLRETTNSGDSDERTVTVEDIPDPIIKWLNLTTTMGNKLIFEFISEQLPKLTGEFGILEDALLKLARSNKGLRSAIIRMISDPHKLLEFLVHPRKSLTEENEEEEDAAMGIETDGDYSTLTIEQIPEDEIPKLPLDDSRAFLPIFDFILDHPNAFKRHDFKIKFSNANSNDGGGPTRNYITFMLKVVGEERRKFFEEPKDGGGTRVLGFGLGRNEALVLGRLFGKALQQGVGLEIALHSQFIALLKDPMPEAINTSFEMFYKGRLNNLKAAIYDPIKSPRYTLDDISDIQYYKYDELRLTERCTPGTLDACMPINDSRINGWVYKYGNIENNQKCPFYLPTTSEESYAYVKRVEKMARREYPYAIENFRSGLAEFIDVELMQSVPISILIDTLRPRKEIGDKEWQEAFLLKSCDGRYVLDDRDGSSKSLVKIPIKDAILHTVYGLNMAQRYGMIKQMTGTSLIPQGGLKKESLTIKCIDLSSDSTMTLRMGESDRQAQSMVLPNVHGTQTTASTTTATTLHDDVDSSSMVEETDVDEPIAMEDTLNDRPVIRSDTESEDESEDDDGTADASKPKVDLPICMSCFMMLYLPSYEHFSEVVTAIGVVCNAADEFYYA